MKTAKHILNLLSLIVVNLGYAQYYLPYNPSNWEFMNNASLVDFSQVKSVTTKHLTLDENEEFPVYETFMLWHNSNQLIDYQFVNYNNSYVDYDIHFKYVNPYGTQLKSVIITNPNTNNIIEEWQYTNGVFDVEKISVKRYLLNVEEPDVFEIKYTGNDDDFLQETVYTPQGTIEHVLKQWYYKANDGGHYSVQKLYLDQILDQTDSVMVDSNGKKQQHFITNLGITSKILYNYKSRKVLVFGEEQEYQELERIIKDGKDTERYIYEYDSKGNWIIKKIYKIKYARWEYTDIIRREIEYKS